MYHQLGLDPVVSRVLQEFSNSLDGMDRVSDRMFGAYDVKGRADAVAKVIALMTYAALSEQYSNQMGQLEAQITSVEGERDQVSTNYDSLVEKVADVGGVGGGGDYDELKASYNQLVERLAEVEHLKKQVTTLNKEIIKLTDKYEAKSPRNEASMARRWRT